MNEIVSKFLLAEDKSMSETHCMVQTKYNIGR